MDVAIVFLSVLGIVLEELKSDLMPINPTIMRVMRVLRIARGKICTFLDVRIRVEFRPFLASWPFSSYLGIFATQV